MSSARARSRVAAAVAACPHCGAPLRDAGERLTCTCGYQRLAPSGRKRAEAKLIAALKALLAEQRGALATVSLHKLARAARATGNEFDRAELRYLHTQWRQVLRARAQRVSVNGAVWRREGEGPKHVVYARFEAEVGP